MIFIWILGAIIILFIGFMPRKMDRPSRVLQNDIEEKPVEKIEVADLSPKLTESYLTLENYVGQQKSVEYLKIHVNKVAGSEAPLPHILLWGSGGLGKSTLIKAVAHHLERRFIEVVPANLTSVKELHSLFFQKECPSCKVQNPFSTNKCLACGEKININFFPTLRLVKNDILFLEECHGLKADIEEAMYSLMQDGYVMLRYFGVDQRVDFPPITIAGATTLKGDLNKPFRDRFKIDIKLEYYTVEEMVKIGKVYAQHKGLELLESVAVKVAGISCGIPRILKKYLDDLMAICGERKIIEEDDLTYLSNLLDIDDNGLTKDHRKILIFILERMKLQKNGGAGVNSIAQSIGLNTKDYYEFYEPALLYKDLIIQGPRGRRLTEFAMKRYFPTLKVNDEGRVVNG